MTGSGLPTGCVTAIHVYGFRPALTRETKRSEVILSFVLHLFVI
jgi:hypothetical protein